VFFLYCFERLSVRRMSAPFWAMSASFEFTPMKCECRVEIVQPEPDFLGLHNQMLELVAKKVASLRRTRFRRCRHNGSNARFDLEQSFVGKVNDYFVSSVGIDFESFAESSNGRKRLAGSHLTGNHGFPSGVNHLFAQWDTRLKADAERYHVCTITDST